MSNIYGEWLKSQREAAGLTQQELADMALMTRSHIAHIEAGRRIPSREDARRLDMALGTGNVLSSFLPDDDIAVAEYFEAALQLEQQATTIREFALSFIPGILQTEGYARAVLGTSFPPVGRQERDRLLVTRLERARALANPVTPVVWALLDEAVLRRVIGSPAVMAEQLRHVEALVKSGRVRVHVLPLTLGFHPLLESMLTLMWFEDQPPVAYSEGVCMGKVHDSPSTVHQLQARYDHALSDALPLKESLALVRATAEDYEHHD
ncbi:MULTISPECIES: helix-turn-helix transcriptional regulator [unclassified Streptomyces]|uniref:helix-turn-helix domain-containing protein n=1 Tax=unclassified Streptomyces TaxID=2593676 RepID=UPI00136FAC60|nr:MULTISPECIES: helix-turn-helix transcriptional regulator [unclassified Streptomyces]NEA05195.1 helix-turn-helix transcriptional regulator [Streptomyces sp. SID10116]MYY86636.1 helix-turn-helix domain-containing protein [Streptomyces sp. SID335]MYZ15625.1 helix-turn-helix domain-containing protein [Streptomyces sp. SID337]NDZ88775.1 helix-turn-helix transcriptional regulator [Streptomyces sp. SID10115]NEB43781.1 helix-turn-helix transcriptional regulator [Streptomyces sp. SID339]